MFDLKILLFLVFAVIIYFLYNIIDKQQDMLKTLEDKVEAIKEENTILEKQIINTKNLSANTYEQLTSLINLQERNEFKNFLGNEMTNNSRIINEDNNNNVKSNDDVIIYSNDQNDFEKSKLSNVVEETTENDDSEFNNIDFRKTTESPIDNNSDSEESDDININGPKIIDLTASDNVNEQDLTDNINEQGSTEKDSMEELLEMKMNELKEISKKHDIKLTKMVNGKNRHKTKLELIDEINKINQKKYKD